MMTSQVKNTRKKGDEFELKIYDFFCKEIRDGRFFVNNQNCKIFRQKGYYSKDRDKEIIFDISIELYLPGAKEFFQIILIECKNYKKSVPVDDAEELFEKVNQVAAANGKAVLASTACFQEGVFKYAQSKGIGLFRYFDDCSSSWELYRSSFNTNKIMPLEDESHIYSGMYDSGFEFPRYNFYYQSPCRLTNSVRLFFEDMVFNSGLTEKEIRKIFNDFPDKRPKVPFLDKERLERNSVTILDKINYLGGEVDLDAICEMENKSSGLVVRKNVLSYIDKNMASPLGKITFNPLEIEVYVKDDINTGRDRFTLAHELSHYLLSHGRYIDSEYFYDIDSAIDYSTLSCSTDKGRMEYQANYLASCILMPRDYYVREFYELLRVYDLSYRGHDVLYVDDQPWNIRSYNTVISHLMSYFNVSKSAVRIRMEALGLLVDNRKAHK